MTGGLLQKINWREELNESRLTGYYFEELGDSQLTGYFHKLSSCSSELDFTIDNRDILFIKFYFIFNKAIRVINRFVRFIEKVLIPA